jgi:hypothetical protein
MAAQLRCKSRALSPLTAPRPVFCRCDRNASHTRKGIQRKNGDGILTAERGSALARFGLAVYDTYVAYIVQHGPLDKPFEQAAETVGAAARVAVAFVREKRHNVRVTLPDGKSMSFETFQEAVFQGDLGD